MSFLGAFAGAAAGLEKGVSTLATQFREDDLKRAEIQANIEKEKRVNEATRQENDYNREANFKFSTDPKNIEAAARAKLQSQQMEDTYSDERFPKRLEQEGMLARAKAVKEADPLLEEKRLELLSKIGEHESKSTKYKKETEQIGKEKPGWTEGMSDVFKAKSEEVTRLLEIINSTDDPELKKEATTKLMQVRLDLKKMERQASGEKGGDIVDSDPLGLGDLLKAPEETAPIKPAIEVQGAGAQSDSTIDKIATSIKDKYNAPDRDRAGALIPANKQPGWTDWIGSKSLSKARQDRLDELKKSGKSSEAGGMISKALGIKQLTESQKTWLAELKKTGKFAEFQALPAAKRIQLLSKH